MARESFRPWGCAPSHRWSPPARLRPDDQQRSSRNWPARSRTSFEPMPERKPEFDGAENMTPAVMGCMVNGPGESNTPTSGSAAGTGEAPSAPVYEDGEDRRR